MFRASHIFIVKNSQLCVDVFLFHFSLWLVKELFHRVFYSAAIVYTLDPYVKHSIHI